MEVKIGTKVQKNSSTVGLKKEMAQKRIRKPITRVIPFSVEERSNNIIDWSSSGNPFASQKKRNRTLLQLFISIAGALLVGTVMGFSVLSLFFSEQSQHSSNSIDSHLPAPVVKSPEKSKSPAAKSTTVKTTEMMLPPLHVTLLQAGNYQSKSSATRVADQYRTKGFAAVMSDRAPYRIYLGVASNKSDANELAKRYLAKGIAVYVRELNLSGKGRSITNLPSALQLGNKLFEELQRISVNGIVNTNKVPVPSTLLEEQSAFMKASQQMKGYPSNVQAAMMELVRGLDQAVQGINEMSKHPNPTLAWVAQEGLVRYASGYEQLIFALSQNQ